MNTIIIILATAFITSLFIYEFFYSPKARVRRLWKEVFTISHEIGKYNSKDSVEDSSVKEPYEKTMRKKEKMINALLDYYFDPEEDREYIKENRPENKK